MHDTGGDESKQHTILGERRPAAETRFQCTHIAPIDGEGYISGIQMGRGVNHYHN